jgi:hypothetical protein
MDTSLGAHFLEDARFEFHKSRRLAEKAMVQISDDDFFRLIDEESNSVAILVKHMAGNMRSRWTDFLTTDGEKPDRRRDSEFIIEPGDTRASLMQKWEQGWTLVSAAIEPLQPEDLQRTILIRHEPHTVLQAIHRQLTHYAYHSGQIVQLARHFARTGWKTLSVPKGKSEEFNAEMLRRLKR